MSRLSLVVKGLLSITFLAISTQAHALGKGRSAGYAFPPIAFDTEGNGIDAHDGKLYRFGDTFYLYGTSYGCGFEWKVPTSPFCGFKVYSSRDLVKWKDRGQLFDPWTQQWQSHCTRGSTGCFRPHVLYNPRTERYVLWINGPTDSSFSSTAYHVFESRTPVGPFEKVESPRLGGRNDPIHAGDMDLFLDDDGRAYIALTDWRMNGDIVVEELDHRFTSGTGRYVRLGLQRVEAPSLFRRGNRYYMTVSDPNCGYCVTGTSYVTAPSPLGPWTRELRKVSEDSCGGQPSAVTEFDGPRGKTYVFQSDLWHNADRDPLQFITLNQALASQYWGELSFAHDGSIQPIDCRKSLRPEDLGLPHPHPQDPALEPFYPHCDIGERMGKLMRLQSFQVDRTGTLASFSFVTYQLKSPRAPLRFELVELDKKGRPERNLYTKDLQPAQISWAPQTIRLNPRVRLERGRSYGFVLSSAEFWRGCYGMAYNDEGLSLPGVQSVSMDGGKKWKAEKNRKLKFTLEME